MQRQLIYTGSGPGLWSSNNLTSSQRLAFALDWSYYLVFLLHGCPSLLFYIDREGCGAVTILVGPKEDVLNYIQKLLSIGIRLVWPILLGFGVVDATPLLALIYGPGQGPWLVVASLGNPVGPASTSLRAFCGWTRRLPSFCVLSTWKPWSGPVLKKSFQWRVIFRRKNALTECSPRASCYLKQKVRGSWILVVEKTKNLFLGYVPCNPKHLSKFFSIVKNSDIGSFIVFLGSQLYIQCWWWLVVGLNSL
jgi:hypothetical protein